MIDICCVGSGVKYHSLSCWPILIMSPQPVNFVPNRSEKSFKKWHNQPGKKRTFRKSIGDLDAK